MTLPDALDGYLDNDGRADHVADLFAEYRQRVYGGDEDGEETAATALGDIVGDLLHHAYRDGVDPDGFEGILHRAVRDFEAETGWRLKLDDGSTGVVVARTQQDAVDQAGGREVVDVEWQGWWDVESLIGDYWAERRKVYEADDLTTRWDHEEAAAAVFRAIEAAGDDAAFVEFLRHLIDIDEAIRQSVVAARVKVR